jgi:hypothetical protein
MASLHEAFEPVLDGLLMEQLFSALDVSVGRRRRTDSSASTASWSASSMARSWGGGFMRTTVPESDRNGVETVRSNAAHTDAKVADGAA